MLGCFSKQTGSTIYQDELGRYFPPFITLFVSQARYRRADPVISRPVATPAADNRHPVRLTLYGTTEAPRSAKAPDGIKVEATVCIFSEFLYDIKRNNPSPITQIFITGVTAGKDGYRTECELDAGKSPL